MVSARRLRGRNIPENNPEYLKHKNDKLSCCFLYFSDLTYQCLGTTTATVSHGIPTSIMINSQLILCCKKKNQIDYLIIFIISFDFCFYEHFIPGPNQRTKYRNCSMAFSIDCFFFLNKIRSHILQR